MIECNRIEDAVPIKKTGRVVELLIIIRFSSLRLIAIAAWCVCVFVCMRTSFRFRFLISLVCLTLHWIFFALSLLSLSRSPSLFQSKTLIKIHCDILFTVVRQQSYTNYAKKSAGSIEWRKGFIDITAHRWFVACNETKRSPLQFSS